MVELILSYVTQTSVCQGKRGMKKHNDNSMSLTILRPYRSQLLRVSYSRPDLISLLFVYLFSPESKEEILLESTRIVPTSVYKPREERPVYSNGNRRGNLNSIPLFF